MRLYLHHSNCTALTNWFFRLQLMRISNWKSPYTAMDIRSLGGPPPTQEGEYNLAEQLLIALYSVPTDRTYELRYERRTIICAVWETTADEGITWASRHGEHGNYIVKGKFRWNGFLYELTAEMTPTLPGCPPKFLQWLKNPSWQYIDWEKDYDPVLPTGKNSDHEPLVDRVFSGKISKEDYSGMIFEGCTFKDVLFSYTNLSGATFRKCTFENVEFEGVNARFTVVEDCIFNNVNLEGSIWTGTSWHKCQFPSPLSMSTSPTGFDYGFYEACRNSGIGYAIANVGYNPEHKLNLPGMATTYDVVRPMQAGDFLLPVHDEHFTYVPIDGAYMLVGDHGLLDGTYLPTHRMVWDAYRLSQLTPDNPFGSQLGRVWHRNPNK